MAFDKGFEDGKIFTKWRCVVTSENGVGVLQERDFTPQGQCLRSSATTLFEDRIEAAQGDVKRSDWVSAVESPEGQREGSVLNRGP